MKTLQDEFDEIIVRMVENFSGDWNDWNKEVSPYLREMYNLIKPIKECPKDCACAKCWHDNIGRDLKTPKENPMQKSDNPMQPKSEGEKTSRPTSLYNKLPKCEHKNLTSWRVCKNCGVQVDIENCLK